jgi:hypothetical protein
VVTKENKSQRRDIVDVTELRTVALFQFASIEGVAFHFGCNHDSQEIMLCENNKQALLMKQALESAGLNVILGKKRLVNNFGNRTFEAFPVKVTPSCHRNGTVVVNCHDPIAAMALEVFVLQPGVHYSSFKVLAAQDKKRSTGGKRSSSHR